MGAFDKHIIHYSVGSGTNLGKARPRTQGWGEFRKLFLEPTRTKETFNAYMKKDHDEQVRLKSVDGWVFHAHVEKGVRNAHSSKPSDIGTLDFDYAHPDWLDRMEMGLVGPGIEYFAHSSRRHTTDKPRIRIFVLFDRPVSNDEYAAVMRILAQKLDPSMTMVDKVSFRPAQMMFRPTASIDGDWFFFHNEGAPLTIDAMLDEYSERAGDWRDFTNLPKCEGEELRQSVEKAEDPTTKRGPVGDFCRAYDVEAAIAAFDLPYEAVGDHSAKPRYSYTKGSTTNGAVVEDGGLFLYSHHGSDPCADMLVNAFDLVRIHKFGDQDAKESSDTPMAKLPSWKAMIDFISDDPGYKREQAKSRYDQTAMFDDVMDDYYASDEDDDIQADIDDLVGEFNPEATSVAGHSRKPRRKPPENWFPDDLELDRFGNIVQNLPNAQTIIHNDPRLFGAIAYDEFMRRVVLRRDILSKMDTVPPARCRDKTRGDIWQDSHDRTVRAIIAAPNGKGKRGYGLDKLSVRDIQDAIELTADRNSFHPIKEYLHRCEADGWDGVVRAERLFIDYLGCPDTPYFRQTARMVVIASVTRIFEPGHKFDSSPVLEGATGIRKSSFIERLYGLEYFGELDCNLKDTQKIAETIVGVWALEFPELSAFHKSDHNEAKRFLSAKEDKVRMAYDRRVSVFPRQATFWGTTNDKKYLKDPTGNRRWWPIRVLVNEIDTDRLVRERDQIWAEGVAMYRAMRAAQPQGALPLFLSDREAAAEAVRLQEEARTELLFELWSEKIGEWADTPISLQQLYNEYGLGERMPDPGEPDAEQIMVLRCAFRREDAAVLALGIDSVLKNDQMSANLSRAVSHVPGWETESTLTGKKNAVKRFGRQARWRIREDASASELALGYRVIRDDLI